MHPSNTDRADVFAGSFDGRRERFTSRRVLGLLVLAGLLLPVIFFGGEYLQRYLSYRRARANIPAATPVGLLTPFRDMALNTVYEIPMPWRLGRLPEVGLPVYDLRVGSKSLRRLHDVAEQVTAQQISTGVLREWVPAEFWIDDDWLPIEVRLRGYTSYHYLKNHPSLRLKFPKHRYVNGRRVINLIEPYDKALTADVATNWLMDQKGILTLASQFVVLRVNGQALGVFQEIEHFGPAIADRNGRPEGYIFSGEGEMWGKPGAAYEANARTAIERVAACNVEPGDEPPHCTQWSFIRDHFDTDRLAWAAALTALLKSRHGWAPVNLRLFWDPARGKFEPIPWDYLFFQLDRTVDVDGEADYSGYVLDSFLRVPEFRLMRDQRLWELLSRDADRMVDRANRAFEELRPALALDVRHLSLAPDEERHQRYVAAVRENQDFLASLFRSHDLRVGEGPTPGELVIANYGKSAVEVRAIAFGDGAKSSEIELDRPLLVDGIWQGTPGLRTIPALERSLAELNGVVARDAITGQAVAADSVTLSTIDLGPIRKEEVESTALVLDAGIVTGNVTVEASRVTFGPGRVVIDHTLEIPPSYDVHFSPGLRMVLHDGVSLLIYGNLTAKGTRSENIQISGVDGSRAWGGVAVQGTRTQPSEVHIEHVVVTGGMGSKNSRTLFTAPFAVHDGVVVMKSSIFRDSATDDGINLKYCAVQVESNRFERSSDDAVDCDFCFGELIANEVVDSRGDGLDFSGSDVVVSRNVVTNCGDKGMSIGERTRVVIQDNTVDQCTTGFAVKDLSDASIGTNHVSGVKVGVAAYVKKQTFGPSATSLRSLDIQDSATRFLHEDKCSLAIEDAQ